jgi:hypothetical protein
VLALVVVAEAVAAHGGRSAVGAIYHDVHTLIGQAGHIDLLPYYLSGSCNLPASGILRFDHRAATS